MHQSPKKKLIDKEDLSQSLRVFWLRRCIFVLLLIIAVPGVLSTLWALANIPDSILILVFGFVTCICVFLGMKIIFSKWGKSYSLLKYVLMVVSVLLVYNVIISFIASCLYGITCDWTN